MSLPKPITRFSVICFCALLFAGRTCAGEWFDNARTNLPVLTTTLINGEMVDAQPVRRALMTFGTNQFMLVVPSGFRMEASSTEKTVLVNADYSSFLTFRIAGLAPVGTSELKTDDYREMVLSGYPGAKIMDEFSRTAANHSGPAFDLQWINPGGVKQTARVAFIPSAAGVLEFSLVTISDKFADGQYFFNCLLLSFRSNEGGKLEIRPLSDKS